MNVRNENINSFLNVNAFSKRIVEPENSYTKKLKKIQILCPDYANIFLL
jgi:hypothetical protein